MRRLLITIALLLFGTAPLSAQVTPTYEGFRNVRTNGNNSTYGQSLTHRYVNGELRFLTLALGGMLHEFRIAGTALGGTVTATTGTWDLNPTDALNNFVGIWFEQAKNRLWVTSAQDYTNVNHPAKVTLISLGSNGSASTIKTFYLNVPAKRVYGGCNAVPAALVSQLGGPYVCGWGGYTSLVAQGGGASIGPTMYAIPDPDTIASGATAPARTILDAASSRGVRQSIPVNYFDGGDSRQNPPSRPTSPPLTSAQWLSPNAQGLGWMTWGDSYYNTGVWIGTTYAAVASLCQGACWYQSSTLAFDGRQFELHVWNGSALGKDPLARPSMTVLELPRGNTIVWGGNIPTGNIAGATYDAVSGRLYLIGFPLGPDAYTGRLYSFTVGPGTTPPDPDPPTPPADTTAPTVRIVSPADGSTTGSPIALSIATSDAVGVTALELLSGDVVMQTIPTPPATYTASLDAAAYPDGSYTFTVRARDAAGNIGSARAAITLRKATPPPPTPVDAVVSDWFAWSGPDWPACTSSPQTRIETRTRTVVTPASDGGSTPPLSETREASRTCEVPPPDPPADALTGTVESVAPITIETCTGVLWWRKCTTAPTGETRIVIAVKGTVPLRPGATVRIEE